jgi:hypothetical protein
MADLKTANTQQLYKQWRAGDANAGQAMAQRFSDWYYAVCTCRLGDTHGRGPLQRACVRFQQGIVSVAGAGELVDWAHGLLAEEIKGAGGRIAGGDFPSQLTGGQSPTALVQSASRGLRQEQVRLLAHAYDSDLPLEDVKQEAEALGGYPLAVLQARYALKKELRDKQGIQLGIVPDSANLDAAPLPLYEAGRMNSAAEEAGFEKWMLSDIGLCKDIAEFGPFAQALRGGAFRGGAAATQAKAAAKSPAASRTREAPEHGDAAFDDPPPQRSKLPLVLAGVGAVLVLVGALVAAMFLVLG